MQGMEHAGFVLMVDLRGQRLLEQISHRAFLLANGEGGRALEKISRSFHVSQGSSPPPNETCQWWWHPAGLLCNVRVDDASTVHELKVFAWEQEGHVELDAGREAFGGDGQSLGFREARVSDPPERWEEILLLEREGRLLALPDWPLESSQPDFLDFMSLPHAQPSLDDVMQSSDMDLLAHRHAMENIGEVLGPWRKAVTRLPEEEGAWVRKRLARTLNNKFCLSLRGGPPAGFMVSARDMGFPIPSSRVLKREFWQTRWHASASRSIQENIVAGTGAPSQKDIQHFTLWLEVLQDLRSPSWMKEKLGKAFSSRAGASALGFHDLLLSLPGHPGTLRKVAWWVKNERTEVLRSLSTLPGPDGTTLPMRLLGAWLHVENEKVSPRKHLLRTGRAKSCLEALAERVPASSWVMETDSSSPWDSFFHSRIFFPGDTDLIQVHREAMRSLIQWALTDSIPLPGHLNVPGQGRFHLLDPGLEPAIERALEGKVIADRGPVADRLDGYFRDLISHQAIQKMEASLPEPSPFLSRRGLGRF